MLAMTSVPPGWRRQIVRWGEAHIVVVVKVLLEIDFLVVLIKHFDIQSQGLQFLNQNLKGFRNPGLEYSGPSQWPHKS